VAAFAGEGKAPYSRRLKLILRFPGEQEQGSIAFPKFVLESQAIIYGMVFAKSKSYRRIVARLYPIGQSHVFQKLLDTGRRRSGRAVWKVQL